ncbi:hypothetical protein ElyMa_003312200 [Elysia marginata]|uniref:Uncharacterized protein n=1 Tax=Elysia marginata TaxID=1093978 RepID=A0AAV4JDS3_9GAST|nr:hypothetical protein ElyMa_003312200 [Elysia marginata]
MITGTHRRATPGRWDKTGCQEDPRPKHQNCSTFNVGLKQSHRSPASQCSRCIHLTNPSGPGSVQLPTAGSQTGNAR